MHLLQIINSEKETDIVDYTILRFFVHRVTADFLTPVISCLEHDNTDLCNTALSHVAELALLMCEGMYLRSFSLLAGAVADICYLLQIRQNLCTSHGLHLDRKTN